MTAPRRNTAIPGRRSRTPATAPAGTAVAYLRVSTAEQAESGLGLGAQRAAIEAEAQRRGLTIVGWYEDAGVSGGLAPSKRPGLRAALAAVRSKEAAILIAAKLDRLSRSVHHAAVLVDTARVEGWQVMTLDLAADMTTPAGEAQAGMLMVFSQLERRLIGQRTREALAVKKAQGVQLGRPTQVPDEVLRRIITEAAAGMSLRTIAAGLMRDGIPTGAGKATWHAPQVQRALDCQRAHELAAEMFADLNSRLA
ncbi:recombinase family protein [Rhodococcus sp. YH1]|uniref:recombinase family protein n=1 Tax=Rhodococcus sp. YH1 TaxID=89066 RepID=UPI0030844FC4